MKRFVYILLVFCMTFSFAGCETKRQREKREEEERQIALEEERRIEEEEEKKRREEHESYAKLYVSDFDAMVGGTDAHYIYENDCKAAYSPSFYIDAEKFANAIDERIQEVSLGNSDRELFVYWAGPYGSSAYVSIQPIKGLETYNHIKELYESGNWHEKKYGGLKEIKCSNAEGYAWENTYNHNDYVRVIIKKNENSVLFEADKRFRSEFIHSEPYKDTERCTIDDYESALLRAIDTMDMYDEFQDSLWIKTAQYTNNHDIGKVVYSMWDDEIYYYVAYMDNGTISNYGCLYGTDREGLTDYDFAGYARKAIKEWYDSNIITGEKDDVSYRLYKDLSTWHYSFYYGNPEIVDPYNKWLNRDSDSEVNDNEIDDSEVDDN